MRRAQWRAREQRRSAGPQAPVQRLFCFRKGAMKKREFLKAAGAAGLMSGVPEAVRTGAWAQGSDAPEKNEVKIGFIPLTDCASGVMASVMEFDKKYGIKIV